MKTIGFAFVAMAALLAGSAQAQQAPQKTPAKTQERAPAPVTKAEAQARAAKIFDRLDANHDGKLDGADREARRQARLASLFDRIDTNHDGAISKQEFTAAHDRPPHDRKWGEGAEHPAVTRDAFLATALQRFDAQDANHDGTVTPEERRAARQERMRAFFERRHRGDWHHGGDWGRPETTPSPAPSASGH